jgi:glutathione S-transferase
LPLICRYDEAKTLTFTEGPEKYHVSQWMYFQMSGQGPYYGQASWFTRFHPEKLPSAINRYKDQVKRVLYVLNNALKGKTWLVGDKWYVVLVHGPFLIV